MMVLYSRSTSSQRDTPKSSKDPSLCSLVEKLKSITSKNGLRQMEHLSTSHRNHASRTLSAYTLPVQEAPRDEREMGTIRNIEGKLSSGMSRFSSSQDLSDQDDRFDRNET